MSALSVEPGRACPADYGYSPSALARAPEIAASALYVAGGSYGNLQALAAAEALAADEPGARLVLNGDVHWFDADPAWFRAVETIATRHLRLRGNVETEIARGVKPGIGCGCAYPDSVGSHVVERSNAIIADLAGIVAHHQTVRERLAALPMHMVAQVGAARIAIVHGDAESLAGWRFDRAALDDASERPWLARVARQSGADVFASTHTCTAVMRRFRLDGRDVAVANNGSAGMPNFRGQRFGIVTRIGVDPSPVRPLYGMRLCGVHVDALPLSYDHAAFLSAFDVRWPAGSAAALSYRARILDGPDEDLAAAARIAA